jgi:ATP-binding cassette subfamily C protein
VDVAGEREIFMRLRARAPRLTTVIIAHRAESLMLCDRVLHMQAGRCVDVAGQPVAPGRAAR